jgi:hypothetical protein
MIKMEFNEREFKEKYLDDKGIRDNDYLTDEVLAYMVYLYLKNNKDTVYDENVVFQYDRNHIEAAPKEYNGFPGWIDEYWVEDGVLTIEHQDDPYGIYSQGIYDDDNKRKIYLVDNSILKCPKPKPDTDTDNIVWE